MDKIKRTVEVKDLPNVSPTDERESRERKALEIAILLSRRVEGRDWAKYPNANQQRFQSKMLRLARDILELALGPPRTY